MGDDLLRSHAKGGQPGNGFIQLMQQPQFLLLLGVLSGADEAALAGDGGDPSAGLQLAVGARDGVGVDGEGSGQLPDAGQLFSRLQDACGNLLTETVDDLGVDGAGVPIG